MAGARKIHSYINFVEPVISADDQFELNEADVWSINDVIFLPETKKHHPRPARKPLMGPRSLPLNIPEWSKILGGAYVGRAEEDEDEDEDEDEENDKMPPHEYLARTRGESLSVHQKLKGRELSRVRNAIWKQTGFED